MSRAQHRVRAVTLACAVAGDVAQRSVRSF
jgi:hypothetical protein